MINIALCGGYGRMGHAITEVISEDDSIHICHIIDTKEDSLLGHIGKAIRLSDIIDDVDLVVDFSPPESCLFDMNLAVSNKIPFVTGTTGFSKEMKETITELSGRGAIFYSPNFSPGINIMLKLLKYAAQLAGEDYDIEIVEMHHNKKVDAPSGTALKIHDLLKENFIDYDTVIGRNIGKGSRKREEIAIHSLRGGDIVGDHKVIFAGQGESFEVTHKAVSRHTFASGVVKAIKFMSKTNKNGLYGMDDLFSNGKK